MRWLNRIKKKTESKRATTKKTKTRIKICSSIKKKSNSIHWASSDKEWMENFVWKIGSFYVIISFLFWISFLIFFRLLFSIFTFSFLLLPEFFSHSSFIFLSLFSFLSKNRIFKERSSEKKGNISFLNKPTM